MSSTPTPLPTSVDALIEGLAARQYICDRRGQDGEIESIAFFDRLLQAQ